MNIHSVSVGPAEDVEAIEAVIDPDVGLWDAVELAMQQLANDGSTMLTERTEALTLKVKTATRSHPPSSNRRAPPLFSLWLSFDAGERCTPSRPGRCKWRRETRKRPPRPGR